MSQNFPVLTRIASQNYHAYNEFAQKGYPYSQYNLGVCHFLGLTVKSDPEAGVYWFRKSAESGVLEAQHLLAMCYYQGKGVGEPCNRIPYQYCPPGYGRIVKAHMDESRKWGTRAAELGHIEAQYNLAQLLQCRHYNEQEGKQGQILIDYEQSNMWFKKAAKKGHKPSMNALASNISFGRGIERDQVQALAYWIASDWEGQQGLFNYYRTMPGIHEHRHELSRAQKIAEAILSEITPPSPHNDPTESGYCWFNNSWRLFHHHTADYSVNEPTRNVLMPHIAFDSSADSPIGKSEPMTRSNDLLETAFKLAQGDGVPKDEVEAYAYFNICAANSTRAKEELAALESKLSRDEIAAGQRRTREILSRNR
jgi:TPR repeat protein